MKMHINVYTSNSVGFLQDPKTASYVAMNVEDPVSAHPPESWVYLDTVEINIKDNQVIRATMNNIEKAEANLEASYAAQKTELTRMKQELLAVEHKDG